MNTISQIHGGNALISEKNYGIREILNEIVKGYPKVS